MSDQSNEKESHASHDRRRFVGAALMGAAGGLVLNDNSGIAAPPVSSSIQKRALTPDGAPAADSGYSPAIIAQGGKLLVISGQGPNDLDADMETQVRQTFDRIGLLLKEAGAGFEHVVILRSYWVHLLRDLPVYRQVRKDYLVKPYPASTAVGTPELAIPGLELEIEAVALLP